MNEMKHTSDVADTPHFVLGKVDTEAFYTAPIGTRDKRGRKRHDDIGWSKQAFHLVTWEDLDATLGKKGHMYKQWLAK